ncbi:unnamed protein product [Onchocerca flexuosa]|uniref:Uncharacterized protein n=1 Tax=Onchocerca flexuosa TaxID=387005 RepID=A0A183HIH5_9BILA|nr:unnamed protein product [Onchocerca flexuosa]
MTRLEPFHKSQFSSLQYIGCGRENWEDRREDKRNMTKDGSLARCAIAAASIDAATAVDYLLIDEKNVKRNAQFL